MIPASGLLTSSQPVSVARMFAVNCTWKTGRPEVSSCSHSQACPSYDLPCTTVTPVAVLTCAAVSFVHGSQVSWQALGESVHAPPFPPAPPAPPLPPEPGLPPPVLEHPAAAASAIQTNSFFMCRLSLCLGPGDSVARGWLGLQFAAAAERGLPQKRLLARQ